MILVSTAVEHHLADSGGLGALGNSLADDFGRRDVAAALQTLFRLSVERAGRNQRFAIAVVDDLRVNVLERTVNTEQGRSGVPSTRVRTR